MSDDEWMTTQDVAELTKFSTSTLKVWRNERKGPPFYKIGSAIRYKEEDVRLWFQKKAEYHANK